MVSPCTFCSVSCCKTYLINATVFDILRIAEKTGKKPEEFAIITPLRLLNYDDSVVLECYYPNPGKYGKYCYEHILAIKSHPCYFLQNNKCSIHEFAPLNCKLYPYGSNGKILDDTACNPVSTLAFRISGSQIKPSAYLAQLQAYRKIVAKWNNTHGKRDDCLKFLLEESRTTNI